MFQLSQVLEAGYKLKIARIKMGEEFIIPAVIGNGIKYVESLVKSKDQYTQVPGIKNALDLKGMECRWDKIKPPSNSNEILCLIVEAMNEDDQARVYKKIFDIIDSLYGSLSKRKPITIPKLKLDNSPGKIKLEMKAKLGRFSTFYLLWNWFTTLIGSYYFRNFKKGREYLHSLVEHCDTLDVDGRINTLISGTPEQHKSLIQTLERMENEGEIIYGHHMSKESIMSCFVLDRINEHIHFVDGSDGGYTRAAVELKKKFNFGS